MGFETAPSFAPISIICTMLLESSTWWMRSSSASCCRLNRAGLKHVQLITDGACLGNPGPGGWACILRYNHHRRELVGSEPHTTNNRMELTAVIEGLKAVKEPCSTEVVTDSQYVKNGITQWIHGWKKN